MDTSLPQAAQSATEANTCRTQQNRSGARRSPVYVERSERDLFTEPAGLLSNPSKTSDNHSQVMLAQSIFEHIKACDYDIA